MTTIPQRELRNNVSDVLRRAETGERFTITVAGRPVAELGPPSRRDRAASARELQQILATAPVDRAWAEDVAQLRDEDAAAAEDPWQS
jgi:prevent-host-death family protein